MRTIKINLLLAGLLSLFIIPQISMAQTGVGIGIATPVEKLDVNGAIKIGTTTTTNAGTIRWTGTEFQGYDGAQWLNFGGSTTGWSLTGNSGTTPGTNFIGTTDSQPLVIKVNNTQAGYLDYGVNNNSSWGYQNLTAITTGARNSAFGYNALRSVTEGSGNAAMGFDAMRDNTTGRGNTAIGTQSMAENTTGIRNTALGLESLTHSTTGSSNTSVGWESMYFNTSGSRNTANGFSAMFNNTNGGENTALGYGSLNGNTTGSKNMALGVEADVNTTNLTNATAIGYKAKVSTSNSMVLGGTGGNAVNVGIGTTSPLDKLHVEGAIRMIDGNQAAGYIPVSDANGKMIWTDPATILTSSDNDWTINGNNIYNANSGNVGIGTSVPNEKLEISVNNAGFNVPLFIHNKSNTTGNAVGLAFANETNNVYKAAIVHERTGGWGLGSMHLVLNGISDNNSATLSDSKMTITATGNVGVGTTLPSDKLEVQGSIKMVDGNQAAGYIPVSDANGKMTWTNPANINTADDGDWTVNGNNQYSSVSGNVGIGTSIPNQKLEVYINDPGFSVPLFIHNRSNTNGSATGIAFANEQNNYYKAAIVHERLGAHGYGDMHFVLNSSTAASNAALSDTKMTLRYNGNLGIGTTTPADKLEVQGSIRMVDGNQAAGRIPVSDANGKMTWTAPTSLAINKIFDGDNDTKIQVEETADEDKIRFDTQGAERMIIDAAGNVGIGTNNPIAQLQVNTNATGLNLPLYIKNQQSIDAGGTATGIGFSNESNPSIPAKAAIVHERTANYGRGDLHFLVKNIGNNNALTLADDTKMTLTHEGNLGIGTIAPSDKLEVQGSIRMVDGNQAAGRIAISDANGKMTWTDPGTITIASDNDWTINGNEMYNGNNGNVGIGTTTPLAALNVNEADESITQTDFTQNVNNAGLLISTDYGNGTYTPGLFWNTGNNFSTKPKAGIYTQNSSVGTRMLFGTSNAYTNGITNTALLINEVGNVGINTTSPSDKLEVQGSIKMVDGNQAAGYIPVSDANGKMTWTDPTTISSADDGDWTVSGNNQYSSVSGNVGIGTNSPSDKLEVQGSIRMVDGNQVAGYVPVSDANGKMTWTPPSTLTAANDGDWTVTGNNQYSSVSGNVGIGTNIPADKLHLKSPSSGIRMTVETGSNVHAGVRYIKPSAEIYTGFSSVSTNFIFYDNLASKYLMTIAVNGNVGVGTGSPNEKLHVEGAIKMVDGNEAAGRIPVSDANGTMTWTDPATITTANDGDWLENGSHIYNGNTGNVGIGTSSPNYQLHVNGTSTSAYQQFTNTVTGTTTTDGLIIGNGNDGAANIIQREAQPLKFYTSNAEKMRIDANGNVGIGTTSPSYKVSFDGNSDQAIGMERTTVDDGHNLTIQAGSAKAGTPNNDGGALILSSGTATGNGSALPNANIIFKTATQLGSSSTADQVPSEKMRITANGNVGIGTTTPSQALHVKDAADGMEKFVVKIENTANSNGSRDEGLLIMAGHNSYNSSQESSMIQFETPGGTYLGRIRQSGSSAVEYVSASDERLKTGIVDTKYGLDDLMRIQVKDYFYKTDPNQSDLQTGFIAQQLYQCYPKAVDVGGDNVEEQPWGVAYGSLTPLLVKAIQEQQTIIDAQKEINDDLQKQIDELKSLINNR